MTADSHNPRRRTVRAALSALRLRTALAGVRLARRTCWREALALGRHLEETLLAELAEVRQDWLVLEVPPAEPHLHLPAASPWVGHDLPGTEALAAACRRLGVSEIRLDRRLEGGQIAEALLALLYVGPHLPTAEPVDAPDGPGGPSALAGAMLTSRGLHRFCTLMRYRPAGGVFEVEYTYCELFYSRVMPAWTRRFSRQSGHRALFAAAPRAALLAGSLVVLNMALFAVDPTAGLIFGAVLAVLLAATVGYLLYTLGSVAYDREHRDRLLNEYVRDVTSLAHFPSQDPNPVLKLAAGGEVLYANPASRRLLAETGGSDRPLTDLLPGDYLQWIAAALSPGGRVEQDVEVALDGRAVRYSISAFPNEPAVLIVGRDVTAIKKLETQLRATNQTLEARVQQRTAELLATQDATILALTGLAETRDAETGQHVERTRRYVRILAEELARHPRFSDFLDEETIEVLYHSAPLHDIGKVGVSDACLLDPGKLSAELFEEMKHHTLLGGDTLKAAESRMGSNSFLHLARQIAYAHHERWDGSGYPHGLAGEAIPIAARLMALADVYDALRCRRRYKPAYGHEKAREIILAERGRQFDPDVVDAFCRREAEFLRVGEELADEALDAQPAAGR